MDIWISEDKIGNKIFEILYNFLFNEYEINFISKIAIIVTIKGLFTVKYQ